MVLGPLIVRVPLLDFKLFFTWAPGSLCSHGNLHSSSDGGNGDSVALGRP